MRKKTIADKIAEKQFNSNEIQKNWKMHEAAFGPILTPAFIDDYQAKVHVCATLNLISNKKLQEALKKLEGLKRFVETDADKACFMFMMGIIFEFAQMNEQMLQCYNECNSYHHNFYMPYIKVAKQAQNVCIDAAVENYEQALRCLENEDLSLEGNKNILASTYTNYASCLLMKHEIDKAKEMLDKSMNVLPVQVGREATLAIYYALMNDKDKTIDTLNSINDQTLFVHTKTVVYDILDKKHFQFHEMNIDEYKINKFWEWFISNEEKLRTHLKNQENDLVISNISEQLQKVFDFMEKEVEFGILMDKENYQLEFCDNYAIALTKGYEKLINSCPNFDCWKFKIVH